MYAIFEKATGKEICSNAMLTTPKKAWDYFKTHHFHELKERGGVKMSLLKGPAHYSNFYECKLKGTRTPALRLAGHALTYEWNGERGRESITTGRCSCGWSESCSSKGEVRREFEHHIRRVSAAVGAEVREPRPAEHLPASERVKKSLQNLKNQGGDRKTFRLSAPTLKELDNMVSDKLFPTETAAVEAAIRHYRPTSAPARPSLYARHVNDADVDKVVEDAVRLACRELDSLFPGVAPDGGRGVSSNFQGLLVEHVKAMLTGKNHAQRSHHTELPALLADDRVFGASFALPEVRGAGYMVIDPASAQVVSAYDMRYSPSKVGSVDMRVVSAYSGRLISILGEDVDALFSSHEAATKAGLEALRKAELTPAECPLQIVVGVFDETKEHHVVYEEEAAAAAQ